ncbi:hypothetical protein AOQ84DRAFT_352189 [Glonium stellatum]|uniref:Alpha/beta hydrolase fold-3 domain-containing protein n=1 Tax=Glonium stellatum TaxID=574774 RepID=A0A8E2F9Z9_9PEZI|nr:hypothetical protein AOQ84DRAFT_352189 [Glonium stellatum]
MASTIPPLPCNPELEVVRKAINYDNSRAGTDILRFRQETSQTLTEVIADRPIRHEERSISGPNGNTLTLSIFRPAASQHSAAARPCLYNTHGGGLAGGNRFLGMHGVLSWVLQFDIVAVTVEYRQPPEHRYPAAVEDCYAGLVWVAAHAAELRVDLEMLVIMGGSAGGGLAAATALMARDRRGPKLKAQMLYYPMLDCRGVTVSSKQFVGDGIVWDRESDQRAWQWYLGEEGVKGDVSEYASPSLAKDLAGLPEAFIEVGSSEVFRDESVAYASRLWEAGVQAELHVWPGGFHAFSLFAPNAKLSKESLEVRTNWVNRMFGGAEAKS